MQTHIEVYVDGCYKVNRKTGAYGIVIVNPLDGVFKLMGDMMPDCTSNQMELMGPREALKFLISNNPEERQIILRSDSKYFVDGFTVWMENWKRKGWKIKESRAPKNLEYWAALFGYKEIIKPKPQAKWVKGHGESIHNRIADQIAEYCVDNLTEININFASEADMLLNYERHIGAARR